jgi:DNA-binding PucR family transcriptional regulator
MGQAPATVPGGPADLARRYRELLRQYQAELGFGATVAAGRGISGLVETTAQLVGKVVWLIDPQHRVVARSQAAWAQFRVPELGSLRKVVGPADEPPSRPVVIQANPNAGLARRHVLMPVRRGEQTFAWLVVAEVPTRFVNGDLAIIERAAFHLASEYSVQRRVARASWNARAALASAEYLGIRVDAARVLVYLMDSGEQLLNEEDVADQLARELGVEVLGSRGSEGTILLVEAPDDVPPVTMVSRVKESLTAVMARLGRPQAVAGVSSVTRPDGLRRAYRESREVALCVDRFAGSATRIITVDDLGPARLFVANSDVNAVRRYVRDVLGALLDGRPGRADLLRTLQCFFDTGRSVRESASRLGIHENTVRLRLNKIYELTGLDVAANSNDQLSAQTALLVLRLEGHPALSPFESSAEVRSTQESA